MTPLVTLLIGHRGSGKTSFLENLKDYARQKEISVLCIDLDQEIEGETGLPIQELWRDGEAAFRKREIATLHSLIERQPMTAKIIALGAGFQGPMPTGAHVIWLRRETDADGRVFLNRPRLDPEISAFDEYLQRHAIRETRFKDWAHEQLVLPEGYDHGLEAFVLTPWLLRTPYDLTMKSRDFRAFERFLSKREDWLIRKFELRDDLLTAEQIKLVRQIIPADQLLYSVRTPGASSPADLESDWAMELGSTLSNHEIISCHERKVDLLETLNALTLQHADIQKLAVHIEDFNELEMAHDWWLKDPERRAFLPRSKDGRWRWYRSLFGPRMPLHFFREDEGSAVDQPLFWQTQLQPPFKKYFAAVLGAPVHHSRSPLEHREFFAKREMPVVAIHIERDEFAAALPFLQRLGLTHAAVTAPLKQEAYKICDLLTPEAESLLSVNTLHIVKGQVAGHNTDVLALQAIAQDDDSIKEVWLWGGGGVRSSVRAAWPQAKEISARAGLQEAGAPDVLIWATGRSNDFVWPSDDITPAKVFDLNYGDNSPGLEWALRRNLPYQSGLKMFKLQADFQRQFWQGS